MGICTLHNRRIYLVDKYRKLYPNRIVMERVCPVCDFISECTRKVIIEKCLNY